MWAQIAAPWTVHNWTIVSFEMPGVCVGGIATLTWTYSAEWKQFAFEQTIEPQFLHYKSVNLKLNLSRANWLLLIEYVTCKWYHCKNKIVILAKYFGYYSCVTIIHALIQRI